MLLCLAPGLGQVLSLQLGQRWRDVVSDRSRVQRPPAVCRLHSLSSGLQTTMLSVPDFYAGRSILVTGASGFLGKVLVEKLLRSVPDLENIYLLIRPQNGLDSAQRLEKILTSQIFDCVRAKNAKLFEKLVAVSGNLMEPELALAQPDMHRICDHVSVVFHCAATVKFDEQLRISVEMNVVGTQRLIVLCHKIKKLAAFVHASTAYANCDRVRIVESVYPPPIQPKKLIDALEWMNDEMVDALTPHMVGRRPNTYTLTKALAEFVLVEESGQLPLSIVRPSIIGATWKEPLVGWTDNLNGPTGLFAAVGKGTLTNMCGDVSAKADIIPVDVVANLLIAAAWHRAVVKHDNTPVINCCTGRLNPVRWGRIIDYLRVFYRHIPVEQPLGVPDPHFNRNRLMFETNVFLKHLLPAYFIDFLCRLTGRKPKLVRMYGKLMKVVETLHFFTSREWDFQTKAFMEIWDQMEPSDRENFNFDVRQIDWNRYLHSYMYGVKKFILKDDLDNIPQARKHMARLQLWSLILNLTSTAVAIRVLVHRSWRLRKWLLFFVSALFQLYSRLRPPALPLVQDSKPSDSESKK